MSRLRPSARAVILAVGMAAAAAALAAQTPVIAGPGAAPPDLSAKIKEGEDLYRQGAYAEALKRFEAVMAAGQETPAVLYQAGACYGQTAGNKDKELDLKKRAIPLLEKEIAGGSAALDSYYYLSAIYINDLNDPVKGTDVARKGVAALAKPGSPAPTTQEGCFRAGRLYSFLGKDKEAAAYYDRSIQAAGSGAASVDRASLKIALSDVATYRFKEKNYAASAAAYESLLKLDPLRDRERHQLGLAYLLGGKPDAATTAWKAGVTDEMRTELYYLSGVVSRYVAIGSPTTSKLAPKASALNDATLEQKILQAAETLRTIREKEAKAKQEADEKEKAELTEKAKSTASLDVEAVKAKFKAKMKGAPAPNPGSAEDGKGDPWQALKGMGLSPTKLPPPPPDSPEKVAADRDFFYLMNEYVSRGHLIRNFCFENGLVEMIFR
jgi:hypothetical protein